MAGIYIHIPFCKQACYYCDFHFSTSIKLKSEMIATIADEMNLRQNEINEVIETIYFGGGTPSLLSIDEIQFLLDTIYKNFKVVDNPEITLEANPDDLSENKILELAKSPINRLSIGVQSFFEDDLKMMNRAHTASESLDSLSVATRHFENITVDLIYGIPNMSANKWRQNLQQLFDLGINHISSYALTVEPNTALASFIYKGKYPPLDEKLAAEHFDILGDETAKNGFVQYEISNFGKEGFFSKHNTSYWKGINYYGFGPSAHSFNGRSRSWNVANNSKYIKALNQKEFPSEREVLSKNDRFNEYIMTGLRTIWGVDLLKIKKDFEVNFVEHLQKASQKYLDQGLLVVENNLLLTTQKGKFLADGIASELFIIND